MTTESAMANKECSFCIWDDGRNRNYLSLHSLWINGRKGAVVRRERSKNV